MVSLVEIVGLALVDAVNPCALAVMTIVLMNLLLEDKVKKMKVLKGGLAFTFAVAILYYIYGLLMIFIFKPTTGGGFASVVFRIFGGFAILLGIFNIKDFFYYKPGGFATEMPMKLRPKMKAWVKRIRTPKGAFVIGLIVTLFLLPCTIGPYVIAAARLSVLSVSTVLWWLLLYIIIFVAPMIGITLAIFLGVTTVEKVGGWKEKNIKYLHLIEGLILTILGILMVTGILA
jgi:cytochrome c biogenesis protein CcdA